jgi:hypothetical protein
MKPLRHAHPVIRAEASRKENKIMVNNASMNRRFRFDLVTMPRMALPKHPGVPLASAAKIGERQNIRTRKIV